MGRTGREPVVGRGLSGASLCPPVIGRGPMEGRGVSGIGVTRWSRSSLGRMEADGGTGVVRGRTMSLARRAPIGAMGGALARGGGGTAGMGTRCGVEGRSGRGVRGGGSLLLGLSDSSTRIARMVAEDVPEGSTGSAPVGRRVVALGAGGVVGSARRSITGRSVVGSARRSITGRCAAIDSSRASTLRYRPEVPLEEPGGTLDLSSTLNLTLSGLGISDLGASDFGTSDFAVGTSVRTEEYAVLETEVDGRTRRDGVGGCGGTVVVMFDRDAGTTSDDGVRRRGDPSSASDPAGARDELGVRDRTSL